MAKREVEVRTKKTKKPVRKRTASVVPEPFDAKKLLGMIPAFSKITLEEMRAWRDDR
ncbi:MAG: hypothetical protein IPL86_11995 [Flavobacteriales bacterium]|jgi:hypothetical protein|nr:hypothetical protein [Flavobacteriales bacterium]